MLKGRFKRDKKAAAASSSGSSTPSLSRSHSANSHSVPSPKPSLPETNDFRTSLILVSGSGGVEGVVFVCFLFGLVCGPSSRAAAVRREGGFGWRLGWGRC